MVLPTACTDPSKSSRLTDAIDAPAEPSSIRSLLIQARSHESSRRDVSNRRTGGRHSPDYVAANIHAIAALDLRLQAEYLDPEHTDPSWGEDKLSPEAQIEWLRAYILRP